MSNASDFVIENGVLKEYIGPGGEVIIPEGVTDVWPRAFDICEPPTNVTLPDSMTEIRERKFSFFKGLTSITLSENVTTIGKHAFEGCENLTSIIIPDSVESIGNGAFWGCTRLIEIICSEKIAHLLRKALFASNGRMEDELLWIDLVLRGKIPLEADQKKKAVASIVSKNNRASIIPYLIQQNDAERIALIFEQWKKPELTELNGYIDSASDKRVPEVLALLMEYKQSHFAADRQEVLLSAKEEKALSMSALSVADWRKVFKFTISDSMITITGYKGTDTDIAIPERIGKNNVTIIGDSAFYGCNGLSSIEIPDTVTTIGKDAFMGGKFISILIPESVREIGSGAFYGCTELTCISIPGGVKHIGDRAFCRCTALTGFCVSEYNSYYSSNGGVLYNKEKTQLICYPCGGKDTYVIPDGVAIIGNSAFSHCKKLTSITLPDGVTSIAKGAFRSCSGLMSITIPDSVTTIGDSAFSECGNLASITIPRSVTTIGIGAFSCCYNLIIHAPAGSYATKYAKKNNIPFVVE